MRPSSFRPSPPAFLPWLAALSLVFGCGGAPRPPATAAVVDVAALAHSLRGATGWLNGGPVERDSLQDRVVVAVTWSDTDPSSLRVLPEAEAWAMAYGRLGVRVLGIHAPLYTFSADSTVPARAARHAGTTFPIALDAASRVRSALGDPDQLPRVQVWESDGRPAATLDGGDFAAAHAAIRAALRRARPDRVPPDPETAPAASDVPLRRVPFGTARVTSGPLAGRTPGEATTFTAQFRYQEQGQAFTPYPVGRWTPSAEAVTSERGGATEYVAVRSDGAAEAWAVLAPPAGAAARVWILSDDDWLSDAEAGDDVRRDARGASYVDVSAARLYSIARLSRSRTLRLSPEAAGLTVYEVDFAPR